MTDTLTHSSPLTVTATQAWRALQNPRTWGAIAGVDEITDVAYAEDGTLVKYSFKVTAGLNIVRGTARTIEAQVPTKMRLEIKSSEMSGSIQAVVGEDRTGGRELTMSLSMRPRGLLAIMFYSVILQTAQKEFPTQVQQFVDRLNDQDSNLR